jgi:hypothetical protein
MTRDDYDQAFDLSKAPRPNRSKRALALALDVRKFEIELYWKRATYFWAFLAVILAGYFALLAANLQCAEKGEALLTTSCLGVIFSIAWYFVNRASKFWQENWESHVDLLEDAEVGPLYKTVLGRTGSSFCNFWKLNGPFRFSVSKLNQLLSLFVVALFALLAARTWHRYYYHNGTPLCSFAWLLVLLTGCAVVVLLVCGRTGPMCKKKLVCAEKRETEIVSECPTEHGKP